MKVHATRRNHYVQFRDHNGEPRRLKCGKIGIESYGVLDHIRHLVDTRKRGKSCRRQTVDWLNGEGSKYAEQLAAIGLVRIRVIVD